MKQTAEEQIKELKQQLAMANEMKQTAEEQIKELKQQLAMANESVEYSDPFKGK
ncbi:hypothetical protein HHK02_11745 [Limosilactobacillus reuteri]|uniref:Uncharacterized protein n=1 Tax=Limosilactobacillus reuteri TaxID=1598 RepID=A0A7L6BIL7_LIMRT|nr:hypothetical protein [Limosilactobacillus reuteri]QLQ61724.1 hypothetical protein HHK02_11745 [Limosilactobacillus reuteri]